MEPKKKEASDIRRSSKVIVIIFVAMYIIKLKFIKVDMEVSREEASTFNLLVRLTITTATFRTESQSQSH